MKIVRYVTSDGSTHVGKLIDPKTASPIVGYLFGSFRVSDERQPIVKLLSPIVPIDILCIGLNYREHAIESGSEIPVHPMLFIKAGNTLNHPEAPILVPRLSDKIDYEGELAIVIGSDAKNVSREDAMKHVFGYTIANDVSARDWQRDKKLSGGQFARGKSFDGFCPIGPWIVTADEILDPNSLRLRTLLNDQVMQDSSTSDMIFDVPSLIESLASTMTLRAGSVILTGTPSGVGFARTPPVFMKSGDQIKIEIEKIGVLANPIGQES